MSATDADRTRLEAAVRALVTAIREQVARTDDAELRALLDASLAAVERETLAAERASHAHVVRTALDLEWRLAVLEGADVEVSEPHLRRQRADAAFTDFLVDVRPARRRLLDA